MSLVAKIDPSRSKFGPRKPLKRYLLKHVIFYKTFTKASEKINTFESKRRPKMTQDRPKTARTFLVLKFVFDLGGISGGILVSF